MTKEKIFSLLCGLYLASHISNRVLALLIGWTVIAILGIQVYMVLKRKIQEGDRGRIVLRKVEILEPKLLVEPNGR